MSSLVVRGLHLAVAGRMLVNKLDFEVRPGQFWCVLGRNGCGKTTLLLTLAGLRPAEGGEILLDERPLSSWNWRALARERALVPQKTVDVFSSTVLDTVLVGRAPYRGLRGPGCCSGSAEHLLARQALQAFDLEPFATRDVRTLSGGERQRVAMAAMLVQSPRLALLDEPTAHLDLDAEQLVLRLLAARIAGHSSNAAAGPPAMALLSLHDVNLAQRFATHVLLFGEQGEVRAGPRDEILNAEALSLAYRHPVRRIEADGETWFVAA
jgi:iron complex transport system ATP-binding protein